MKPMKIKVNMTHKRVLNTPKKEKEEKKEEEKNKIKAGE